MYNALINKLE